MTQSIKDLLIEKCKLHKVNTTGCKSADDYRQALDEQAPQWEQEEENAPPRRRRAATETDKKRMSGEVQPPLETSCAKKPKPPPTLVATKPDVKEPSDALVKACEAVLANHGKPPRKEGDRIKSSAVWLAVKREFTVTGRSGYSRDSALSDATLLLYERYEAIDDDTARANSPLRWLNAGTQIKQGKQHRPGGKKKKKTEVDAMATEVATAVAAARTAKIMHSVYGKGAVELSGEVHGLLAEYTLVKVLRATTVQEALQWGVAPPWLTQEQVAAFWRVLAMVHPLTPLYDIREGALVPTGLPRVDFWIALAEPIARCAASLPEFASLLPLVDYMCPVHVKKNAPDFGPGGGAHAGATLTSGIEAHARRFVNRRSSIVRGPDALRRSPTDAHTYAPRGVATDELSCPTEGLIANVSLAMKNGELAVEGAFIGATRHETFDFGDDNAAMVTTFTTKAAAAGHGDARDCKRFERENAFGHALAAAFVAAVLNVADLARVSSWVLREAMRKPPSAFVRELYQDNKVVEWAQHALPGTGLELALRNALVAADLRLEMDRKGGAYDSALLASRDALLERLRERDARLEWKAKVHKAVAVVHGAGGLVGTARKCCLVVWTDLGSGPQLISAADAPFCVENIERTLKEAHDLHVILDALSTTDARDEAYGEFLKKSPWLQNTRLGVCFIGDLDNEGKPLKAHTRRVSFAADWAIVKTDIRAAVDYCLKRRDEWRVVTPDADELRRLGPRMPTADPIKLVVPTSAGVATDITQPAPPLPPLVVQPRGDAGGLAGAPKPPPLRTPKARPTPWKESVERESIAAARPKKKARRKK